MGDDFKYKLFFPYQNLWPALEDVARLSDLEPEKPLQVVFPDCHRSFPFEAFGRTPAVLQWDERSFEFATALIFERDEILEEYQRREKKRWGKTAQLEADEPISIGYIYVAVETQLPDTEASLVEFSTPGSSISFLFRHSVSIRNTFVRLLRAHQGVCGVFDVEMSAEIFWWKGKKVQKIIEGDTSDLTFRDFEKAMRGKGKSITKKGGD